MKIDLQYIKIIAENPGISPHDFYEEVIKQKEMTMVNIYKMISTLINDFVLIKKKGKLYLHETWIYDYLAIAEMIKDNYIKKKEKLLLLPGETKYISCSSLYEVETIRADLILSLRDERREKDTLYFYNSHAYFPLGSPQKSYDIQKKVSGKGNTVGIIGNDTVLDNYGAKLQTERGYKTVVVPNNPFMKEGYCLLIHGPIIYEIIFPEIVSDYFKLYFQTTYKVEDFSEEFFQNIFHIKQKYIVKVRSNEKEAENYRKVMKKLLLKNK